MDPQEPKIAEFKVEMTQIKLKNDNKLEREFINLLLMDENCLKRSLSENTEVLLEGSGIGALYRKIIELYRQKPSDFDTLATVLMNFVEPVSFLTAHLMKPLSELNEAQRMTLLNDYINRLKELQRRKKLKQIASSIGSNSSIQDLEQIVNMKKRQLSEKGS
jgi:hypothetical protein